MEQSRSKRQVLILDCCYGGAFAKGMQHKAGDKVIHTRDEFEVKGRIVFTASNSMQYSFEGDTREGYSGQPSVFTSALVNGLKTGKADLKMDGCVSYHELYEYAFEQVRNDTPLQKPEIWVFGVGDVIIANNPNEIVDPHDLIQDALESLNKDYFNETIEYCDRAIKLNPRLFLAHHVKGLAYSNLKQYSQALACFDAALVLKPNYTEALVNRGRVLAALNDHEKAVESNPSGLILATRMLGIIKGCL